MRMNTMSEYDEEPEHLLEEVEEIDLSEVGLVSKPARKKRTSGVPRDYDPTPDYNYPPEGYSRPTMTCWVGMLEYHYRSRDPSLITVSNKEFYEDRLVLPPSPLQLDDRFGLKFSPVPGVYSSRSRGGGRPGTNRLEAEAVVRALADHAKAFPDFSIGIVTFSKAQADMMTEVLELARRQDSVLDEFLREGQHEDVFVKNIENVQGDERDVILISVGYGPHEPNGLLASMNFGPINSDGGERRLNVLFTRARVRCEVFASFDPGETDLSRTKKNGPRVLKRFLMFAKSGEQERYRRDWGTSGWNCRTEGAATSLFFSLS